MKRVQFTKDALMEYQYYVKSDKKGLKKIYELIIDIDRSPYEGIGNPEALKGEFKGLYSRRINSKDRLVYVVIDDTIVIYQCKGHYKDK